MKFSKDFWNSSHEFCSDIVSSCFFLIFFVHALNFFSKFLHHFFLVIEDGIESSSALPFSLHLLLCNWSFWSSFLLFYFEHCCLIFKCPILRNGIKDIAADWRNRGVIVCIVDKYLCFNFFSKIRIFNLQFLRKWFWQFVLNTFFDWDTYFFLFIVNLWWITEISLTGIHQFYYY